MYLVNTGIPINLSVHRFLCLEAIKTFVSSFICRQRHGKTLSDLNYNQGKPFVELVFGLSLHANVRKGFSSYLKFLYNHPPTISTSITMEMKMSY